MAQSEQKLMNRWLVVVAALIMQLCLGTLYAFSVFSKPLITKFKWTVSATTLAFTIALVFFTLAMIVAGRWQDKVGPRRVGTVGGLLLGLGAILAGFTTSLPWLYISYGVIAGAGIGFAYVTPIATIVKWFPDMRGLMTGVAVFGFGAGSLIFAPLAAKLIAAYGIDVAFWVLGVIFLVAVMGSAQLLNTPPPGYRPAGWNPPAPAAGVVKKADYAPGEMVAMPQFWLLWLMYVAGATGGLMIISQAAPMAQQLAKLTAEAAAAAVGLLAIFNGLGRLFWGFMSDKIGRKWSILCMFAIYAIDMFFILPAANTYGSFLLGIALAAISFGGYLALMPAFTADFFGTKNVGTNYGWLFTAYGVAAIFGPMLIAQVKQATGGYNGALLVFGVISLVGIVLAFLTNPPGAKAPAAGIGKQA